MPVDLYYFSKVVTIQEGVINMLWTTLNVIKHFFLKRSKNPSSKTLRERFVLEFRSSLFKTGNTIRCHVTKPPATGVWKASINPFDIFSVQMVTINQ